MFTTMNFPDPFFLRMVVFLQVGSSMGILGSKMTEIFLPTKPPSIYLQPRPVHVASRIRYGMCFC